MIRFIRKKIYIISILLLLIVSIGLYSLSITLKKNEFITDDIQIDNFSISKNDENNNNDNSIKEYYVDIKGAIIQPGVYKVNSNNNVLDVIKMAGGLLENADTSLINLAKKVTDQMVIYIYTKDEVKNSNVKDTVIKVVEKECICPNIKNDGCINDKIDSVISNTENESNINSDTVNNKLVNINKASLTELQSINGIGESKAKAIVKYREDNGLFENIEELKKVTGIGESLYEQIKIYITT